MIEKLDKKMEFVEISVFGNKKAECLDFEAGRKLNLKINELVDAVNVLQAQVAILEEHAHPTAKTPDYDDTDDIAEVKNENLYTKKKLDRAMWWLKEIVNNHRFTPITTAEMALKELNKKTSVWDIQDYLKSNEDLANFLESALEENDYDFLKIAVNDVITALRKKRE